MTILEINRSFNEVYLNNTVTTAISMVMFLFACTILMLAVAMILAEPKKKIFGVVLLAISVSFFFGGIEMWQGREAKMAKKITTLEKEVLKPYVENLPVVRKEVADFVIIDEPVQTGAFFFPKGKQVQKVRMNFKHEKGYPVEKEMAVEIVEQEGLTGNLLVYKLLKEEVLRYPIGEYDAQLFVPKK